MAQNPNLSPLLFTGSSLSSFQYDTDGFTASPSLGLSPTLSGSGGSSSSHGDTHYYDNNRPAHFRSSSSSSSFQIPSNSRRSLKDVTVEELVAGGNLAFINMTMERNSYAAGLKEAQKNYKLLLETMKNPPSAPLPPSISLFPYDPSVLILYSRESFKGVRYWRQKDFTSAKTTDTLALGDSDDEGGSDDGKGFPWVEDCDGKPLSVEASTALATELRSVLIFVGSHNRAPSKWSQADVEVVQYVRAKMYALFPDLRLCLYHWKLTQILTKIYPSWIRTWRKSGGSVTIKGEALDPQLPAGEEDTLVVVHSKNSRSGKRKSSAVSSEPAAKRQKSLNLSTLVPESIQNEVIMSPPSSVDDPQHSPPPLDNPASNPVPTSDAVPASTSALPSFVMSSSADSNPVPTSADAVPTSSSALPSLVMPSSADSNPIPNSVDNDPAFLSAPLSPVIPAPAELESGDTVTPITPTPVTSASLETEIETVVKTGSAKDLSAEPICSLHLRSGPPRGTRVNTLRHPAAPPDKLVDVESTLISPVAGTTTSSGDSSAVSTSLGQAASSSSGQARKRKSKDPDSVLTASDKRVSARNLAIKEYLEKHPGAKWGPFEQYWSNLPQSDPTELARFTALSKSLNKEKKERVQEK
ncbi:hypothetical protein B0H11DRAFT_1935952 [Mycena galericulata]|nr:hypothetical protein B0H11DRAFT_1935952 [Mycena galericulata]